MKRAISAIIAIAITLAMTNTALAQKETININYLYENPQSRLITDTVIKCEGISAQELMTKFENWGGRNFQNYSAVRTSKTESQISLKYISGSATINNYLFDMYTILIAEFKDGRFKLSFYDNGNAYRPGTYIGNTYIRPVPENTYFLDFDFEDGSLTYKQSPGMFNYKQKQAASIYSTKNQILKSIKEIESDIKSKNETKASDW
jgi:hypothetical protein